MPRAKLRREPCDCLVGAPCILQARSLALLSSRGSPSILETLLPFALQDCREPAASSQPTTASAAIARQQPPPKSLVLCLTGALQGPGASSLGEADVPHLDALVAAGWAGMLACRTGGPPLAQQLLGLAREGEAPAQSLADRCEYGRVAARWVAFC